MELIISKALLMDVLNKVSKFIPSRATHPVLEYIKLNIDNDIFIIEGTDLNNSIKIKLKEDIEIIKEGSICVPSRIIFEIISKASEGLIKLTTNGNLLEINSGSSKFNINGIEAEEYPSINYIQDYPAIKLKAKLFKKIDKYCRPFCSDEMTKGCIQGINIRLNGGDSITGASTDGHRLTKYQLFESLVDEDVIINFTLQSEALVELVKNIKSDDDDVLIRINETISLEVNNTIINSRLLEGTYPQYDSIIPKHFDFEFSLNRKELISGLDLISVFSKNKNDIGLIEIEVDGNAAYLKLSCDVNDIGSGNSLLNGTFSDCRELDEQHKEIPFNKIGINVKYLIQQLKVFEGESIILKINSPNSPLIITPYSDKDKDNELIEHLLMPVQLRNL